MQSRVKETVSYTWTIEDFVNQTGHIDSPSFSTTSQSKTFSFSLCTDMGSSKDFIFIENWFGRSLATPYYNYRVSILGKRQQKLYSKEYHWKYDGKCYCNIANFISKNNISKFLIKGNLTLLLEVDILDGPNIDNNQVSSQADLSKDYQSLFESGKLSDFTVAIGGAGGEKQFRVHKTVLAARSAVFAAMFEHSETKEVKEGRMELDDISVEACEELLRFIYTGKVTNMSEHASELLSAANKYQLEQLKAICEQSLISSVSIETATSALVLADMHNAAQLKSKCIEYITNNSVDVMATESWKVFTKSRSDLVVELFQVFAQKAHPLINKKMKTN